MGPQPNALEEVKRDAIRTTLRHFRNEEIDNGFQADVDLDQVESQLLGESGEDTGTKKARGSKKAAADEVSAEAPAEAPAQEATNGESV